MALDRRLPTADCRLGLYIHIPFCSAICNYCNFNRGLFDAAQKARYVQALLAEIKKAGGAGRAGEAGTVGEAADTIYFGGGTPSLLEPVEVAAIIAACREAFDVASDAEVTLEANPESVDEARLAAFRHAGVNRLSFGVQSFREEELRRLSRLHTVERATLAVSDALGNALTLLILIPLTALALGSLGARLARTADPTAASAPPRPAPPT